MNLQITRHAGQRYCERYMKVEERSSASYYTDNKKFIDDRIQKQFEHAEIFFKGQIGQSNRPQDFYKQQDTIFVVDPENTVLITIFRMDFGIESIEANRNIFDILMDELNKSIEDKFIKEEELLDQIGEAKETISKNNELIDELKSKIKALEEYKESAQLIVKASERELKTLKAPIDRAFQAMLGKNFGKELKR